MGAAGIKSDGEQSGDDGGRQGRKMKTRRKEDACSKRGWGEKIWFEIGRHSTGSHLSPAADLVGSFPTFNNPVGYTNVETEKSR